MLQTSAEYQEAVVAGSRSSVATVLFGVFDVTAKQDANPTANGTQPFTEIEAIKGDIREQNYKLATFEENFFRLDGSAYLMPDDANPDDDIIGWYSLGMSDVNGEFATPPTITINFSQYHSSMGVGLFFGSPEYCVEFDVTWYDGSSVLGYSLITDNAAQEYNVDKAIENYNKIIIRFFKTRRPYRYARLMELEFGLEAVFDSSKLVEATILEETDPSHASLTVNTLKFTVLNDDQAFNMLNPQGIYAYLQKRQKLVAKSGLVLDLDGTIEYVNMGTYYLENWTNANGLTATLSATDAIGLLDKTIFRASRYWVNEPVENVLRFILADAGDFSMTISTEAALERVTGYIPVKSHREALADVLAASNLTLRVERSGILNVDKLSYSSPVASIDFDTMIGNPEISQKPFITSVEVKEFTYTLAPAVAEITNATFAVSGTQTVVIDFGKAAANTSVVVTGATVVGSPVYSAVSVSLTLTGSGQATVVVNGQEYVETSSVLRSSIPAIPAGEVPQTATIDDNNLITSGKGLAVLNELLDYFQRRISQKFSYWSNPALQAGDDVTVLTMFGTEQSGIIERQEITIAPKLIARLEVTG